MFYVNLNLNLNILLLGSRIFKGVPGGRALSMGKSNARNSTQNSTPNFGPTQAKPYEDSVPPLAHRPYESEKNKEDTY
jgi:hypothetical protein